MCTDNDKKIQTEKSIQIWFGGNEINDLQSIQLPDSIQHVIVHRAIKGHYQFLLGADLIHYGQHLYCGWGNSKVDENDAGSIMAYRRRSDNGSTWDAFKILAPAAESHSYSHGVFFEHNKIMHALVPRAKYQADSGANYDDLQTELFRYDTAGDLWNSQGIVIPDQFWPTTRPTVLADGTLILPGMICKDSQAKPAVALCDDDNLLNWEVIMVPVSESKTDHWGEGALIDFDDEIWYLFRNGWGSEQKAQLSISRDGGRTWSMAGDTDIPCQTSKLFCGMLSDNRPYIVLNPADSARVLNPADSYRGILLLAVGDKGQKGFSKVWRIRYGQSPKVRIAGIGKHPQWAYPAALEHDGKLYIAYAITKEDCGLSIVNIKELY